MEVARASYALFPIKRQELWSLYEAAYRSFWTPSEIDLSRDRASLELISHAERAQLLAVLSFFAASDVIVNDNLVVRFYAEIDLPEARQFYAVQMAIEAIHTHVYASLIEAIADAGERETLFDGIENVPSVREKARFARKYTDPSRPLGERLVAYAFVEGVLFSSSFACIFNLKKRGLFPGLTHSNDFIARDEGLHARFSCAVYGALCDAGTIARVETERVVEIAREAAAAELAFVEESLAVPFLGMNAERMREYVKFVADYVLGMLGVERVFFAENPFDFMDLISLDSKKNFFEARVSEYAKPSAADRRFALDEEF
jgi:ribonucleotide reductase beta subunit family protein with ferritin-like domain